MTNHDNQIIEHPELIKSSIAFDNFQIKKMLYILTGEIDFRGQNNNVIKTSPIKLKKD